MAKAQRKALPQGESDAKGRIGTLFESSDIERAKKQQRNNSWNKKHPTYSFLTPEELIPLGKEIRRKIKSASEYDQDGILREDGTTADDIATIFIDYALAKAKEENINFSPTPKGKMKLGWEEAETAWEKAKFPAPQKTNKSKKKERFELAYRWTAKHQAAIQELAGDTMPDSNSRSPHRYMVPIGEVVLRLLQRALNDYETRKMRPTFRPEVVKKIPTGWA